MLEVRNRCYLLYDLTIDSCLLHDSSKKALFIYYTICQSIRVIIVSHAELC